MKPPIEQHPLGFFLPCHTAVMMLGSFPPPKERWSMDFYYPNFQNDMWRILGIVFYGDKDYFVVPSRRCFNVEKVKAFCSEKGIGLGDTAMAVVRQKNNASDKFLEVVTPADIGRILREEAPECRAIVVTGQKSMDTLMGIIPIAEPPIGTYSTYPFEGREVRVYRMPSSSRAYPKPLGEKAEIYAKMFRELGY